MRHFHGFGYGFAGRSLVEKKKILNFFFWNNTVGCCGGQGKGRTRLFSKMKKKRDVCFLVLILYEYVLVRELQ